MTLAIDGLPQESWPAMLADLDALPIQYRFSTRFLCLDQYDAAKEIDGYRKGWRQQVYRFLDQFFNNPAARANRYALLMSEDAEQAMTEVQGGIVGAGYLTSCIVLMDENLERVQKWARELRRSLQTLGFGCRIESINALEAWLGTHPGNTWANIRRPLINTLNLADLLPLASVWTGAPACPCPFYPPESPPLAVFTTDGSTPFWFNLHFGDIGHTLIFGPTGAGKSTLLALLAAQFRRYRNAQIFAFDKGLSLFPLCHGAGGTHYNIGESSALLVFRWLLILEVCFLGIKAALNRDQVADIFKQFVMLLLAAGFFLAVINRPSVWASGLCMWCCWRASCSSGYWATA